MRATLSLTAAFTIGAIAIWLPTCTGKSEHGPTILAGMDPATNEAPSQFSDPRLRAFDVEGSLLLAYRGPGKGGVAYHLTLQVEGQRAARKPSGNKQQPPVRESHALEVEFRKLPVEGTDSRNDVFLLGLDALHYTQKQRNPAASREIEIADDRFRLSINGETSIDNRGNRITGPLAPRIFLNRIFGVITHDPSGNPIKLSSRGAPAARQFMSEIPILGAIAYTMVSLPQDRITPGSSWTGVRIPPSRSGELGLSLTVHYSLAGFEIFEGVTCAMILINAHISENEITSTTGHKFDRVQATLNGTAWVELENSLVRRVVLSDQIRASWVDPGDPKTATEHRIQHTSKLVLALRDPNEKPDKWSDGAPRFNTR
ncbi:MAG: hypothetical protein IH973_09895 [Myxococcales bacterium]|nr:hypothetical protein [Myxococcales bacterium]